MTPYAIIGLYYTAMHKMNNFTQKDAEMSFYSISLLYLL